MIEHNKYINEILYLCFDKWNTEIKGRKDLKEFLDIMCVVEEKKSLKILRYLVNYEGLLFHKGILMFLEKEFNELYLDVSTRIMTRRSIREQKDQ